MILPVSRLSGHGADVTSGKVSPDVAHVATCSADKSLYIWDTVTAAPIRSLLGHGSEISDISFHGSTWGLLSSCLDGVVRLFDLRSHNATCAMEVCRSGSEFSCVTSGHAPGSPLVAAGSTDGYIRFFDLRKNPTLQVSMLAHYNTVCSLETSDCDSMVVSSSLDGTIRLWSATEGDCLMTVNEGTSNPAPCVYAGFSPDTRGMVALFLNSSIRRWDLNDRVYSKACLKGPSMTASTKTFAKMGSTIAVPSEDGTVYFLDSVSGKQVQSPTKAHADDVLSVHAQGGLMVSTGAGEDSSAVLWVETSSPDQGGTDYRVTYNLVAPQIEGLI